MLLSRYVLLIQVPFLTYSHNLYLQTWLELGLPGMLALAWLLTVFFVSLTVLPQLRHRTLAQATALGLLATFLHGIVDARQYVDLWTGLPVFVLLGLHAALVTPGETAPMKRSSHRRGRRPPCSVCWLWSRPRRGQSARRGRRISGPCGRQQAELGATAGNPARARRTSRQLNRTSGRRSPLRRATARRTCGWR